MCIRGRVGFWVLWGAFLFFRRLDGSLPHPRLSLYAPPVNNRPIQSTGRDCAAQAVPGASADHARHGTPTHTSGRWTRPADRDGGGVLDGARRVRNRAKHIQGWIRTAAARRYTSRRAKTAAARKAPCGGCSHFVESSGKITSRTRRCTRSRTLPAAS